MIIFKFTLLDLVAFRNDYDLFPRICHWLTASVSGIGSIPREVNVKNVYIIIKFDPIG